jgi:hypothetical protein
MRGILFESTWIDFLLVTAFLGGGAAYLTGRAVALTWRPVRLLVAYIVLLTCAVRFVHFALFEGSILGVQYFLVDLAILLAFGGLGFQITRSRQMAGQYSWVYQRVGPLSWRVRQGAKG